MTEDRMETLRFLAEKFPDGDFAHLVGKLDKTLRVGRELAEVLGGFVQADAHAAQENEDDEDGDCACGLCDAARAALAAWGALDGQ